MLRAGETEATGHDQTAKFPVTVKEGSQVFIALPLTIITGSQLVAPAWFWYPAHLTLELALSTLLQVEVFCPLH